MVLDDFWANSDAALDACGRADTVGEVIDALNAYFTPSSGEAFFGGSGGDRQLIHELDSSRGWELFDIEADYYFKARDRNGDVLEYCEGDVSRLPDR